MAEDQFVNYRKHIESLLHKLNEKSSENVWYFSLTIFPSKHFSEFPNVFFQTQNLADSDKDVLTPVDRKSGLDFREFYENYSKKKTPVVVERYWGNLEHSEKWNHEFLVVW